jgi:hypothetical protein
MALEKRNTKMLSQRGKVILINLYLKKLFLEEVLLGSLNKFMLNGYKTYIMGTLAIISVLLKVFELIDEQTLFTLLGIFLAGEGMAIRNAIKK